MEADSSLKFEKFVKYFNLIECVSKVMASLLTSSEIESLVADLPQDWTVEGKQLKCVKVFNGFPQAVNFINSLVEPSESYQHHPDLQISYNRVTICLTTHDSGGLTYKDFELAKVIAQLG